MQLFRQTNIHIIIECSSFFNKNISKICKYYCFEAFFQIQKASKTKLKAIYFEMFSTTFTARSYI